MNPDTHRKRPMKSKFVDTGSHTIQLRRELLRLGCGDYVHEQSNARQR